MIAYESTSTESDGAVAPGSVDFLPRPSAFRPTWNPFAAWRRLGRALRDMRVRHARERAALTAHLVEVEHLLAGLEP